MNKYVLTAAMAALMGLSATAAVAEHHGDHHGKKPMMQKVDTDGNGVVSKAEFLAKHEEMFNRMDTDNDGNLTPDEMRDAREKMKEKWEKYKEKKEDKAAE